jgi:hypothetical protein
MVDNKSEQYISLLPYDHCNLNNKIADDSKALANQPEKHVTTQKNWKQYFQFQHS